MCEFCKPNVKSEINNFTVGLDNKFLTIGYYNHCNHSNLTINMGDYEKINIEFCPMCGRKLGE